MTTDVVHTPRRSRLLEIAVRVRRANMALVLVLALFVGLVIGAIMIILTTPSLVHSWATFFSHPGATISKNFNTVWFAYEQIFEGSLFDFHAMRVLIDHPSKAHLATALGPISLTLQDATPLIVAGLGLAIGFRSNIFDIGGQGQVIAGGLIAGFIGFSLHLTPIFQVSLELVGAMLAGALLASLAGVLKAYTGAHEVIVTMMSNYIMVLLMGYLLITNLFARPGPRDGASKAVTPSGQLPYFFSHLSTGLLVNLGFLFALLMVFVVQWFFDRSKTGFELLMVGQNGEAARTAGINSKRTTIIILCLAGGFCGLAGMLELTGVDHFLTPNFGGSYGFDAITVALLGRNRPWGVFFGAIFFGAMYAGGEAMQAFTPTNIQYSLAQVIQAVVVFCVATPALVIEIFRLTDSGRFRASGGRGVDEMTVTHDAVVNPEIVTLENLRLITRERAFGYGVTLVAIGVLEILWFGRAHSALETTIQLGYNSSTALPPIGDGLRILPLLIGLVLLAPVVSRAVRQKLPQRLKFSKGLRNLLIVVGGYLVVWPVLLWCGVDTEGVLRTLTIPVSTTGYVIGLLSVAAGGLLAWKRLDRSASPLLYAGLVFFMIGFLVWVARGSNVSGLHLQLTGILAAAVAAATFLIFGSLSGTLCERSGVVNIAIEGQFMTGAMSSVMVVSALNGTGISKLLGVVVAGLLGALLGWVLAVMSLRYQANQIIVGIVIVAFCTAVTQFIMFQVLDTHQNLNGAYPLPVWSVPFFSHIPIIGPILFDQNILVYVAILGVVIANIALFRTRWGLRVRSVGEKPIASETVGVSVTRMRYGAVILGGFVAGLGGAAFTIGPGTNFTFGMTNGYGYIALAIMIFGRWRPYGALMASLLFGFTIALSANLNIYLSQLVIPQQFISMLPYIITIAAVAGLVGRIRPPAADGVPFHRE